MNNDNTQRLKLGKQASMTGIGVNFLLFIIKIIIGISAKSMALVADAVNNFTDMATAIISLVGFNMASNRPMTNILSDMAEWKILPH